MLAEAAGLSFKSTRAAVPIHLAWPARRATVVVANLFAEDSNLPASPMLLTALCRALAVRIFGKPFRWVRSKYAHESREYVWRDWRATSPERLPLGKPTWG